MKVVTTPFPFPLVQMTRTFLFLWVFTLPFALTYDIGQFPALLMIVFFVTYGFIGLEFVSIELDDPFGVDDNDFDVEGLALVSDRRTSNSMFYFKNAVSNHYSVTVALPLLKGRVR